MLSYQHIFHAGNHADVLKHIVLIHVLKHFLKKNTPFWMIDTHAGSGFYSLKEKYFIYSEFQDGIKKLWNCTYQPKIVSDYLNCIKKYNVDGLLRYYPGSPYISLDFLRKKDKLRLFEIHPGELKTLEKNIKIRTDQSIPKTIIKKTDGFNAIKMLLPPSSHRGIIFIDPSYEDKSDYRKVLIAIKDGLKRFCSGTYVIWYPKIGRIESKNMQLYLENLPVKCWLHISLNLRKISINGSRGLLGSGLFLINPPHTLYPEILDALPYLKNKLAQDDSVNYAVTFKENNIIL
ncbi:MAG: 23S rRNA (adenine(2030)-N(6))-methyltransferase RlmJ [Bordetella sp.]|nr:MAG: 23S rRNA (adenine(2030)-N(6))-methyltransferase RlmJ [Bordetella sp.]